MLINLVYSMGFSDRLFQSLFSPLVKKLGYDYPESEVIDTALLRTLVVGQALDAGDERFALHIKIPMYQSSWGVSRSVIKELSRRFKVYQDTGDESQIPADLQSAVYSAVRGGDLMSSVTWS